jgi:hypothetical protein
MMKTVLVGFAAAALGVAVPAAHPMAPNSAYYPESCPVGNMCVYSQETFKGNEISSPISIAIDIPGNFGGVHSWYNNTPARWCVTLDTGGTTYIDPYGFSNYSPAYTIVSLAANGKC